MKAALFFVGLFFSCFTLLAQSEQDSVDRFDWLRINPTESYADFAWESLPKGITQAMVESLVVSPQIIDEYITSEDPLTLFYFKDQLLALLPCRFDVLRWTGVGWENLYKGTSSGFNCHPHFFVREGKLYSMGRYGFWRGHSELLEFDFQKGHWEFVPVSSPPVNYGGVGIFVDGDRVLSILGENIHQPTNVFYPDKNGYVFDFKSKAWSSIQLDFPNQKNLSSWIMPSFDLKDYGVQLYQLEAHLGLLLLHKKENTLYFAKENDFGKFRFYTVAVGSGNSAVFFDKYGDPTFLTPEKDFEERFKKVGDIRFNQQTSSFGLEDWSFAILAGLLLLMAGGGGLWWRKNHLSKKSEPAESLPPAEEQGTVDGVEDIARLVAKLLAQPVLLVDVHQLDQVFGASELESLDYRRVRRSRYIKAVNQYFQAQYGKDLIVRTKSETDKRIILYRISP
jgi:hypothetical protein